MSDEPSHLFNGTPVFSYEAGPFRVNYANTDRMGHAYHAEYLVWFECARTELLRSLGRSYRQWEDEDGVFLPVTECSVQFRRSALYDDLLMIDTRITRLTRASVRFHYRLYRDSDKETLATGHTTHAFMNAAGKVMRVANRLLPQFF